MDYNKIRGAAMAYYANSSHEEQLQAWKFFKSLDTDGNGTVSRQEYLSFLIKEGYTDTQIAFGMLDRNGDGGLDFEECTTLFYIIRVHHGAVSCKNGCGAFLWPWDIYFVCAECYEAGGKTYDLCCDCYRKKNFKHQHAVLFDNFKLLKRMQPKSASQRILEELVKTARLYYKKSSPNVKESARNFFTALDYDNDEKVSLQQFLGFMRETGHTKMCSHRFFKELDIDGNGTLEFMEVMALYYIIKSGRPFCGGCGQFIPGMYFTCFKCFENGKNSFCVCPECYDDERFIHEHVQFLDNYALLEAKRLQVIAKYHKPSSSVTITELPINDVVRYVQNLPKPQWENLVYKAAEVALKALDLAIEVALKGVQLTSCTIM